MSKATGKHQSSILTVLMENVKENNCLKELVMDTRILLKINCKKVECEA